MPAHSNRPHPETRLPQREAAFDPAVGAYMPQRTDREQNGGAFQRARKQKYLEHIEFNGRRKEGTPKVENIARRVLLCPRRTDWLAGWRRRRGENIAVNDH